MKGKWPNGLAAAMKKKGMGPSELARLAGTKRQNILRYRDGERELVTEWAIKLAPHLDTTPDALLELPEIPETRISGLVGAGGSIVDVSEDTSDLPHIEILAGSLENASAAEIRGASMARFEGWYAIFSQRDAFHSGLYGKLCVMETEAGDVLIKWIDRPDGKKSPRNGNILISGDGTVHGTNVPLKWAAPVIGMRPRR